MYGLWYYITGSSRFSIHGNGRKHAPNYTNQFPLTLWFKDTLTSNESVLDWWEWILHSTLNNLGVFSLFSRPHERWGRMSGTDKGWWQTPTRETDSQTLLLSHLAEKKETSDRTRRGSRGPLLSEQHGCRDGRQRGSLSAGQQPLLIRNMCCEDSYTCASLLSVHHVGRAAVFICSYTAEGDQMIGPAMAHCVCTSQYSNDNKPQVCGPQAEYATSLIGWHKVFGVCVGEHDMI